MTNKVQISLSDQPDGYGFYYGSVTASDGRFVTVNLLPPRSEWSGDIMLEGYEPDERQYIVYADGEEIARIDRRSDINNVTPLLEEL